MVEKYHPDTRFAFLTKAVAESSFGIPVSQETLNIWVSLARGCGVADDVIDNTFDPDRRQLVTKGLIEYIAGIVDAVPSDDPNVIEQMGIVKSTYQTLPQNSQESLIRHLKLFGRVTEKTRNETNIAEYSKLRMLEGQLNMELFHDTASESMKSHPNFSHYRKTVNRMIRAGNNLDALIDLKDDFTHTTTQIQPTLFNKIYLLKDAVVQMAKGFKGFNIHVIGKIFGIEKWDTFYHKDSSEVGVR